MSPLNWATYYVEIVDTIATRVEVERLLRVDEKGNDALAIAKKTGHSLCRVREVFAPVSPVCECGEPMLVEDDHWRCYECRASRKIV